MREKFFCPSKWQELFLYLNHGTTNSCHHPIPHIIPLEELRENPAALHNTKFKMAAQQKLLYGLPPKDCHMCSHIEKSNPYAKSDRHFKMSMFSEDTAETLKIDPNHVPKLIEIVFDNLCNLTCSYCDSGQSSSWAKQLIKNGPFGLQTDHRNLYEKIHISPGSTNSEYLNAWNIWWNEIKTKVEFLRISGGEPLTSPNIWNFIDSVKNDNLDLNLGVNSNLSFDQKYLEKLSNIQNNMKRISISASIDSTNKQAEFIRAGLNYDLFYKNVHWWCQNTNENCVLGFISTVNIFSIWGIEKVVNFHIDLKKKYGENKIVDYYSTIVRFPEFQNILILPRNLREKLNKDLTIWMSSVQNDLSSEDIRCINKSINYLVDEPKNLFQHNVDLLRQDLKKFLVRYQTMTSTNISDIYPKEFVDWLDTL